MKRRIQVFFILVIMILSIFSNVQAVYFDELGLRIEIPEEYINLADHINANQEIWEKYNIDATQIKEYYQKNGVILDTIHQDNSKSLVILKLRNTVTKKIRNLNTLSEESLQQFLQQYIEKKEEQNEEVQSSEIYQKENLIFFHCQIRQNKQEEKLIQVDEYYTIINGVAVSVSLNYLTGEMQQEELKNIINTVQISSSEIENITTYLPTIFLILFVIVLYGMSIVKEKKGKFNVEKKEKSSLIHKAIQNYGMGEYEKFGGYLAFFLVTIVLSALTMGIQVINFLTSEGIFGALNWQRTYNLLLFLQIVIQIVGLGYIALKIMKREAINITKIKKTILIVSGITIVFTVFRVCISYIGYHIPFTTSEYYQTELTSLVRNVLYLVLWYLYYRNSMRVQVYYKAKTLEEVIENPSNNVQQRKANRMISEAKIRDYLEKNKAMDKKSAILLSDIPEVYIKSAYFSGLANKKIIKTTMGKAYLNEQKIKDEKFEKKRQIKTTLVIVIVYLLAVLLTITI